MGLRSLLYRIIARRGRSPAAPAMPMAPDPAPITTAATRIDIARLRFRPQICCETRAVASVLVIPPRHLDGDADAILRDALAQRRAWIRAGITAPPMTIELPRLIAESAHLAQPLIWEIDRQDCAPEDLIFSSPSPGNYSHALDGLALLSRHGCGIELDCLDPMGMAVIRDLKPQRARMRVPPSFLPSGLHAPSDGQHILSLLALAERHGLATLVDDIGSRAEFDYLAQLGFGVAQGDPVAPVLDANACAQFLSNAQWHQDEVSVQRWPAA